MSVKKYSIGEMISAMSRKGYDVRKHNIGLYQSRYIVYRGGWRIGMFLKSEIVKRFLSDEKDQKKAQ